MWPTVLSLLASLITIGSFYPYVRDIRNGTIKPHVFSWFIWSITTLIVFLAQLADGGGWGAWPIGLSGVITVGVTLLAWQRYCLFNVTRWDWGFLVSAGVALILWALTDNPLWAAVIMTTVDVLGFAPTLRQAYHHPHQEQVGFYLWFVIRNILVCLALENLTITTLVFPVATGIASGLLVAVILYRRQHHHH